MVFCYLLKLRIIFYLIWEWYPPPFWSSFHPPPILALISPSPILALISPSSHSGPHFTLPHSGPHFTLPPFWPSFHPPPFWSSFHPPPILALISPSPHSGPHFTLPPFWPSFHHGEIDQVAQWWNVINSNITNDTYYTDPDGISKWAWNPVRLKFVICLVVQTNDLEIHVNTNA